MVDPYKQDVTNNNDDNNNNNNKGALSFKKSSTKDIKILPILYQRHVKYYQRINYCLFEKKKKKKTYYSDVTVILITNNLYQIACKKNPRSCSVFRYTLKRTSDEENAHLRYTVRRYLNNSQFPADSII